MLDDFWTEVARRTAEILAEHAKKNIQSGDVASFSRKSISIQDIARGVTATPPPTPYISLLSGGMEMGSATFTTSKGLGATRTVGAGEPRPEDAAFWDEVNTRKPA